MTGARPRITRRAAPLTCPSCGRKVSGHWPGDCKTAAQKCPCGHAFEAAWPGFTFEPETIVIDREPS